MKGLIDNRGPSVPTQLKQQVDYTNDDELEFGEADFFWKYLLFTISAFKKVQSTNLGILISNLYWL